MYVCGGLLNLVIVTLLFCPTCRLFLQTQPCDSYPADNGGPARVWGCQVLPFWNLGDPGPRHTLQQAAICMGLQAGEHPGKLNCNYATFCARLVLVCMQFCRGCFISAESFVMAMWLLNVRRVCVRGIRPFELWPT